MATYRNIQISFWTDSKVADEFTPEDKYFYLYLMTNPHTNTCGCYEISIRQMSIETGYSKETISKLIERMEKVHNVIRYSSENKEILLINWRKYNWTSSEKLRKSIFDSIRLIKTVSFKNFLYECFECDETEFKDERYPIDRVSNQEKYPIESMFCLGMDSLGNGINIDSQKLEKDEKKKQHEQELNDFFESIWKLYIRKEGKSDVSKKTKEELFKVGYDRIKKCIEKYAKEKAGCEKKYILMGSTFFNGRYKDYLEDEKTVQPKVKSIPKEDDAPSEDWSRQFEDCNYGDV